MKATKKILAFAMAVVMLLALGTVALAEDTVNNSITITNTDKGTYRLFKLFDLTVDSETNPTKYTYTVNEDWEAFFTAPGAGAAYVTIDEDGYVTDISDAKALAKAAAAYAETNSWANMRDSQEVTTKGTPVVFENLENGYWLVTSPVGTAAMADTTPDKNAVTIAEKNKDNTTDKQVKEDDTGTWGSENDKEIGGTVEFRANVTIVPDARNVKFHDKMDEALTYNAGSVTIEGLTAGTDYTVVESGLTDGCTFEVVFSQTFLDSIAANRTIVIEYTAVLNEKAAVLDENGNPIKVNNKDKLTWGENSTSEWVPTITTSHKFAVLKFTGNDKTKNIGGAVFNLKKAGVIVPLIKESDTVYRVAMPNEAGAQETFVTIEGPAPETNIVIKGVDSDDDYSLFEVEAPTGYNKLKEEVAVEVEADNSLVVEVENNSGSELPSTGGIGTTLFYVFGSLMVLGALVFFITKRRMNAAE